MTQTLHRFFGLSVLVLMMFFQACGRISISDDCECGFYTISGTQKKMHWPDGTKIQMKFDASFPEAQRFAVEAAMDTYNKTLDKTTFDLAQSRNSSGDIVWSQEAPAMGENPKKVNGDGINGIYWITEEWPWQKTDPNSDAMTVIQFNKDGIAEADVYFKAESYGKTTITDEKAKALFSPQEGFNILDTDASIKWVYLLAAHELGHVLGRTHNDEDHSVMNGSVEFGILANPFSDFDKEILSSVYSLK